MRREDLADVDGCRRLQLIRNLVATGRRRPATIPAPDDSPSCLTSFAENYGLPLYGKTLQN